MASRGGAGSLNLTRPRAKGAQATRSRTRAQNSAPSDPTHIKALVTDPENRRKHNPRNIGVIVDGLQRVGAARSIVIDEDNVVLAGNGVLEAAAEAGITKVQVVETDGDTVVAVRRRGLTTEQKRDLAITDNRAGELAEWNWDQLKADQQAGLTLEPWFSKQEVAKGLGEKVEFTANPTIQESYQVLVTNLSELTQAQLLERLTGEGYECRALMS